jgi:hypothetical protein
MSGSTISGMTPLASLPSTGALVPVVLSGDPDNYNYDLGAGLAAASPIATRTALALISSPSGTRYLTESGREGTFVFSTANLSTLVTGDPNQGIYVAPSSDTTGASGAWVRQFDGVIQAKWLGGTWDGVANDGPTILAAVALANALVANNLTGYGEATRDIQLPFAPNGIHCGTSTIALTNATRLKGYSGGEFGGAATLLKWDAGCNLVEIHAQNSSLEDLTLKGGWVFGTTAEGEYHGVKAYYKFTARDLYITNCQGDGLHINISGGSGGDTEGNANGSWFERCTVNYCRKGVYLAGADANAGNFHGVDANYCRQANIWDDSFLGNTHVGPQTSGGGVTDVGGSGATAVPYTCCYNNGHIFYVIAGQDTGASTNSPPSTATSNTWWGYWKDSGAATSYAPQWVSGLSVRTGGGIVNTVRVNGQSVYLNVYSETDQPPMQFGQNDLVLGYQGAMNLLARRVRATVNGVEVGPSLRVNGSFFVDLSQLANSSFQVDSAGNATDVTVNYNTGNVSTTINYQYNGATFGSVVALRTFGILQNVNTGLGHYFRVANVDTAIITSTAIDLQTGKVLSVNGTQVVGARQTGCPAAATDLASAITLVNFLRSAGLLHGFIS